MNVSDLGIGAEGTVLSGSGTVAEKLDRARTELLDLSARNRLLNMPRSAKAARTVEVVDEKSTEIFRLLIGEAKAFTFIPGMASRKAGRAEGEGSAQDEPDGESEDSDVIEDLALPEDDVVDERGVAGRHSDTRLQTRFTPEGLQKRLLDLYFDARTLEDEQGVNVLFLTLGALRWVDPNDKKNIRRAPLILVPVALERGTAGEHFRLRARAEDFATNLSLETFLDRLHGIRLPETEVGEDFDIDGYFDVVARTVESKEGWGVERDVVVLGFFSFAKFMMYRDLNPETWPSSAPIATRPLLKGLLVEGFEAGEPLIPDDQPIDSIVLPSDLLHILDSDSSQTLAVHEVRQGRNLVIQGPPGTGKSQTIANLVAAAVADGKTVLFVAEKMAALEVVKRRLDSKGIGAACLELHSHKANKKSVLEDIRRTWENGAPRAADVGSLNARLGDLRDELNGHAARMHQQHSVSGLTHYQVIGQLVRLRAAGEQPNDIALVGPETWSKEGYEERHAVLRELVGRIDEIGIPSQHIWHGVRRASITPMEVERLMGRLKANAGEIDGLDGKVKQLADILRMPAPEGWTKIEPLLALADRLHTAPLSPEAASSIHWSQDPAAIERFLAAGEVQAAARHELSDDLHEVAWTTDLGDTRGVLGKLARSVTLAQLDEIGELAGLLPPAIEAARILAEELGMSTAATVDGMVRLAAVARHVIDAPVAPAEAFSDPIWERGLSAPRDLLASLTVFRAARAELEGKLNDSAWNVDLASARATLAARGTGMLRVLSGDWRQANRSVRACLVKQDQSLEDTLAQLDRLQQGKAARAALASEEIMAKAAFGSLWRGERSDPEELGLLLTWMARLGDLSAPARHAAARRPDKAGIAAALSRLSDIEQIRAMAERASGALGVGNDKLPHDLAEAATKVAAADKATRALFIRLPDILDSRLRRLERLQIGQESARITEELHGIGEGAFGALHQGAASDWPTLRAVAKWVGDNADILNAAGRVVHRQEAEQVADEISIRSRKAGDEMASISGELELDLMEAFGQSLQDMALSAVAERLRLWAQSGESLFQWVAYCDRAERGRALGCAAIVDRISEGTLATAGALPAFEMAYFEALYLQSVKEDPELGRFDGTLHARKVEEFSDLDLRRIHVSADEVVKAHHRRLPPREGGAIGPLGVLRNELQKRRGHMPIRRLVERAGPALQAMKPVFMMSPLSVAQFLPPGAMEFDLLVMDEASQIQPVDALGAVARARQVVVVGDPRQLPPTSFFARMTSGGDEEEDEGGRVTDIESILGLFTARGLPMRMLRWHYRSKHQSLIAVSNRQFYDSKLFVVPSPYTAEAGMGLRFHHVPDGLFDAGGKAHNLIEARVVARAIIQHALEHPDLSLGVAAFSVAQRRAIMDELELQRRAHPETEGFFHAHPSEPFFVKNLENVQGDERDVIFISVGYGPTVPGGRVPMRFGPLGSEGGERRLNVLISRAKQRCEVFSSMTDEDIEPDFASSRKGVFAFRLFLQFARTGRMTMAEATGRDFDSVFEVQVAKALQERGYHVHRQVGLAGFFIDLAVSDPERPGRYLLGIECDGLAYHDALSARDRDRLRQSVLESHGWNIHRIWSTDWFQRPQQELDRVIAAIEAAKADDLARQVAKIKPVVRITSEDRGDHTLMGVEIGEEAPEEPEAARVPPYEEARLEPAAHYGSQLHDLPRGVLVAYVEKVAEVEGPVLFDEIIVRIREAWGLKRAGSRIRDAVTAALEAAVRKGTVTRAGDFVTISDRAPVVRDRSDVASTGLRKPEAIPLDEIAVAAVMIVTANFGAQRTALATEIARLLGFRVASELLRRRIASGVDLAIADGRLTEQEDLLQLVS